MGSATLLTQLQNCVTQIYLSIYFIFLYISVKTQQSFYSILFINKLFHAFMQSVYTYIFVYMLAIASQTKFFSRVF